MKERECVVQVCHVIGKQVAAGGQGCNHFLETDFSELLVGGCGFASIPRRVDCFLSTLSIGIYAYRSPATSSTLAFVPFYGGFCTRVRRFIRYFYRKRTLATKVNFEKKISPNKNYKCFLQVL